MSWTLSASITQPVKHSGGGVYGVGTSVVVKVIVSVSVTRLEKALPEKVKKEPVSTSVVTTGVPEALRKAS
jgi:hypothetical protein